MHAINYAKLVWVTVPAGTTVGFVPFPDIPELRTAKIVGIEVYDTSFLANTPDGQPCAAAGDLTAGTLVLRENSTERHEQVPLQTLYIANTQGIWKEFTPFVCNWQASGVQFTNNPATATQFTVPFTVFWTK